MADYFYPLPLHEEKEEFLVSTIKENIQLKKDNLILSGAIEEAMRYCEDGDDSACYRILGDALDVRK